MNTRRYEQLKAKLSELRSDADKAKGEQEQLLRRLRKDFACKSIKEAKRKLAEMEKEREKLSDEFSQKLKAFLRQWEGSLE